MLSQGAHEIRNPVAVITGYVRMLTSERMGPTTEGQRKVLGEISTSAGRLAALADEMSLLSLYLAGNVTLTKARLDLASLVQTETAKVAKVPERDILFTVIDHAGGATITGDATRLRAAINSLLYAQARELVTTEELSIALDRTTLDGQPAIRLTMGGGDRIKDLRKLPPSELAAFVEFRGGVGFTLSIARQIIQAHGGQILSKIELREDPKATPMNHGTVVFLPAA
jgi:signal transduction histidine kinase